MYTLMRFSQHNIHYHAHARYPFRQLAWGFQRGGGLSLAYPRVSVKPPIAGAARARAAA